MEKETLNIGQTFCRMQSVTHDREVTLFSIVMYCGIFILFLFVGLQVGSLFVGEPWIQSISSNRHTAAPSPSPTSGYLNVLIVVVDRLNTQGSPSKPRLESLWMVNFIPEKSTISLFPIYPIILHGKNTGRLSPEKVFSLNLDGELGNSFVKLLEQNHLLWNGYVILDEISMIEIINISECVNRNDCQMTGALTLGDIPRPWEDELAAAQGQSNLFKKLCDQAATLSKDQIVGHLFDLIPGHIRTDLDPGYLLNSWQELSSKNTILHCEFNKSQLNLTAGEIPSTP
jgi:hypothetical protein